MLGAHLVVASCVTQAPPDCLISSLCLLQEQALFSPGCPHMTWLLLVEIVLLGSPLQSALA